MHSKFLEMKAIRSYSKYLRLEKQHKNIKTENVNKMTSNNKHICYNNKCKWLDCFQKSL